MLTINKGYVFVTDWYRSVETRFHNIAHYLLNDNDKQSVSDCSSTVSKCTCKESEQKSDVISDDAFE